MSALFPEDATQEEGKNYVKSPLSTYNATSDTDMPYHHQAMKEDDRKDLLLDMIK